MSSDPSYWIVTGTERPSRERACGFPLLSSVDTSTAERLAQLHADLAAVYADLAREPVAVEPERVLTLHEAAVKLGMTVSWLSRRANWEKVGGYSDTDRRVKFALSTLEQYIRTQRKHRCS